MNLNRNLRLAAVAAFALFSAPQMLVAQPGAFGGGYGPPLAVVPPPRAFASSDEHYNFLLAAARGGTKHTIASVPRWDGLWVTAGNTHMSSFIDPPGFAGKVREGVLTPPYERPTRSGGASSRSSGEVQYRSPDALRAARLSAVAPRAVLARVHQPSARVVLDQRFRSRHPPRLHRPGAQERVRHALLVRRHDRVLGRQQAGHAHEVPAAGRLHALVADDQQPIPRGRNVGAQALPRRLRAARGAGHRSTIATPSSNPSTPSTRSVAGRISRRPAIASSTGSVRRATTTCSTRARRRRGCLASRGSRTRGEPRCFRICQSNRATRSTTARFRAKEQK